MFKTMFNAPSPILVKVSEDSETVEGQSKSIREMYEKYVATGIPMNSAEGEFYDSDIPVDSFGVELEELQERSSKFAKAVDEYSQNVSATKPAKVRTSAEDISQPSTPSTKEDA